MIFLYIIGASFWPLVIIGVVVFLSTRRRGSKQHLAQGKSLAYSSLATSKEDLASQFLFLLSLGFLGVTLLALNKDVGDIVSWQTILFIVSIVGLFITYHFKTILTLVFSVGGLIAWWIAQASFWAQAENISGTSVVAGVAFTALVLYVVGSLHRAYPMYRRFALLYSFVGIMMVTGLLFFFSTKYGLHAINEITGGPSFIGSWQITFSLLIFLVALCMSTLYSAGRKLLSPFEFLAVFGLACLFGFMTVLPEQIMFYKDSYSYYTTSSQLSGTGMMWALVFNVILFFELLGLIFSGYSRREPWLVNMGVLFMLLFIIIKYFDWFFTFLDKSLFFIGAGLLLFGVGWFIEKGRKRMIANMAMASQQISQQ